MSRFTESDEFLPENMVSTGFGFCLALKTMPKRKDVKWLKLPERHIYDFDGDGWYRIDPPEPKFYELEDLKHG